MGIASKGKFTLVTINCENGTGFAKIHYDSAANARVSEWVF